MFKGWDIKYGVEGEGKKKAGKGKRGRFQEREGKFCSRAKLATIWIKHAVLGVPAGLSFCVFYSLKTLYAFISAS